MTSQTQRPALKRLRSSHRPFATIRTITALILREMSTTYGRSPGGYIWAVLEPVGGIALMTVIFSTGFRSPSLGDNFAMYYATGFMPYYVFMATSGAVTNAVNFSRQLLAYPGVTFLDAILARFTLNLLTQLMVSYIVLSAIRGMFETRTVLDFESILLAWTMAAGVGLGFGTINCFLASMFQVWRQIWAMISRPLLLASGVIFLHDRIPEPYATWLEWNPLVHAVGESRAAFYPYYQAEYVDVIYVALFSLIGFVFGLIFLRRYKNDILNY